MKIEIPKFESQKELFDWLKKNEDDLIYQKKSEFKRGDELSCNINTLLIDKTATSKNEPDEVDVVKVRVVINTTMVRDSHKDVHINGLWDKSLKENKRIKHLQEHRMSFDSIISDKDDLQAYTKTYEWRDLGFDYDGKTEALVFDSNVRKTRNPFMYKEYKDENVDNHSVGMQYVKIKLAINSPEEEDKQYKEEFDKHIDNILNREEVEKDGYFWAVYEAKVIEGSAVVLGSNSFTPTLPVKARKEINKETETIKSWLGIE